MLVDIFCILDWVMVIWMYLEKNHQVVYTPKTVLLIECELCLYKILSKKMTDTHTQTPTKASTLDSGNKVRYGEQGIQRACIFFKISPLFIPSIIVSFQIILLGIGIRVRIKTNTQIIYTTLTLLECP